MNDVVFVALGTFSIYLLGLNTDQMNAHVQGFYAHLQLCSVALWSTAGGGGPGDGRSGRGAAVGKNVFGRFILSFDEDLCLLWPRLYPLNVIKFAISWT